MERVIQTIQHQFEAEVRAGTVLTDRVKPVLQAWLHRDYHVTTWRDEPDTPGTLRGEYAFRRHVNLAEVREFFHEREHRRVDPGSPTRVRTGSTPWTKLQDRDCQLILCRHGGSA